MAREFLTGRITRIEQCAPATRRFWINFPDLELFDFIPGQFITFDFPIGEKPKERWRSYSIASNPDGTNTIELVIVLVEGGKGTTYLFNEADVGTEIPVMGPLGKFNLPQQMEKDICFICTGTGIAPFRSMLRHIRLHGIKTPPMHLIFGTRHLQDILYYEEMKELANDLPQFTYHPVLSRAQAPEWDGLKGYVHPVYEELFADKRPVDFFLCGWKIMIDEARKRIADMGYTSKDVHLEIYG